MGDNVSIVWAKTEDKAAILALLHEMHADVGIFSLSTRKLAENVEDVLANGRVLLAIENEAIVGTVGLYVGSFWYSEERVLMDSWIYTSTRAKDRLATFRALIKEVRAEGIDRGLPVIITLFCEDDKNQKANLFGRYGDMVLKGFHFNPVGGDYRMN